MNLKDALSGILRMLEHSPTIPFILSEGAWQDVVYFAKRLGWERTYDTDGVCRHIKTPGGKHNIRWDKETKRPYYTLLSPVSQTGRCGWFDSLEDVLARILEEECRGDCHEAI